MRKPTKTTEENETYHDEGCILSLGEISDKMFFVTKGKVGVFVDIGAKEFINELQFELSLSSQASSCSKASQVSKGAACKKHSTKNE